MNNNKPRWTAFEFGAHAHFRLLFHNYVCLLLSILFIFVSATMGGFRRAVRAHRALHASPQQLLLLLEKVASLSILCVS